MMCVIEWNKELFHQFFFSAIRFPSSSFPALFPTKQFHLPLNLLTSLPSTSSPPPPFFITPLYLIPLNFHLRSISLHFPSLFSRRNLFCTLRSTPPTCTTLHTLRITHLHHF